MREVPERGVWVGRGLSHVAPALRLFLGLFVPRHEDGRLRALVTIHMDETLMTGGRTTQEMWEVLQGRVTFGSWRSVFGEVAATLNKRPAERWRFRWMLVVRIRR